MKHQILSVLILLLGVSDSWAHGEDKYGPHKGFVKMPGAFHIEVVLNGSNTIKVYLLDIDWKNPTIEKSSLEVSLKNKSKDWAVGKCDVEEDHYLCSFSQPINLKKKGELKVLATRLEQKGIEIVYNLPLKLK